MSPRTQDPADQGDAIGLEFVTAARYACISDPCVVAGQCQICRGMVFAFSLWSGVFAAGFTYAIFTDRVGVAICLLTVACLLAGMAGDTQAGDCHDDELQALLEDTRCD